MSPAHLLQAACLSPLAEGHLTAAGCPAAAAAAEHFGCLVDVTVSLAKF